MNLPELISHHCLFPPESRSLPLFLDVTRSLDKLLPSVTFRAYKESMKSANNIIPSLSSHLSILTIQPSVVLKRSTYIIIYMHTIDNNGTAACI